LFLTDRWFLSIKTCSDCGCLKEMALSDRIYTCDCGNTKSRDWNAAINIRNETLNELNRHGICRINGQGDASGGIFVVTNISHESLKCQKFEGLTFEASLSLAAG
jgi:hypothetical protein